MFFNIAKLIEVYVYILLYKDSQYTVYLPHL